MTNEQYGNYQTPSSRPPEPPYRVEAQPSSAPELRGVDQRGETYDSGRYNVVPSSQQPVVNVHAHGGDTASMPYGSGAAPSSSATATPSQASTAREGGYAATSQSSAASVSGVASAAPSATSSAPRASYSSSYESVRSAHQVSPQQPRQAPAKSAGGGKSFLFGFLGALIACVLCLGGFAMWNGSNSGSAAGGSTTTLGTTDSSVINAVEEGQTLAEAVAAKALPSVVAVYNYQQSSTSSYSFGYGASNNSDSGSLSASGMGSGVLISKDGYILTNYHVVEDADKLTVKVGDEERDAEYVGGDESSDVAVIKVDDTEGLEVADIGDSDSLVIGEWVMTVGAPLGLEQSVATGVVSATNRSTIMSDSSSSNGYSFYTNTTPEYTYYPNMIQTDAVINPGNSGGALVDADGKLIGINTMISSYSGDYAGVGFAIPVNYAMGIAEDVIAGKEPTHAALGVSVSSVTAANAKRYGLKTDSGAYIASIVDGSGAADSDLQVGDIITAINGKEVTSATNVTLDVREHSVGDTITVTVNRDGETLDIPVVLSSDESLNSSSSQGSSSGSSQGNGSSGSQGQGSGSQNGYDMEQLEELLKMLGF